MNTQSTNTKVVQSQLFIDLSKWIEEVQNDPVKTKEVEKILQEALTPQYEPSSLIAHAGERKRKIHQIFDYDSENSN